MKAKITQIYLSKILDIRSTILLLCMFKMLCPPDMNKDSNFWQTKVLLYLINSKVHIFLKSKYIFLQASKMCVSGQFMKKII